MVESRQPHDHRDPSFIPTCVHLRCKSQFYRPEDEQQPPGMIADSPWSSYWCDQTQDGVGPDQKGCDPQACQAGRGCFAAVVGKAQ